jgi:hypothetical protein
VTIPGKFFQKKFKQNFSLPVYVYKKQQMKKIILYILPIISFSSCMLFQPSAKKLTNRALSANKQYDAVIVPGVPFLEPKWDRTMQMRVMWAIHLYKNGSTKKIIMSGGSSMLRHFPDLVERRTGVKAVLADDAFYCVAKGTGIALEHLDTYKRSIFAKK